MATPWAQVAASPAYQALPDDQKEAARQQYFAQVVAPQISDPAQQSAAKAQFDQQTSLASPSTNPMRAEPYKDNPALFGGTFGSQLKDSARAAGHQVMNALHGGAQAVEHSVGFIVDQLLPAPQQNIAGLVSGQAPKPQGLLQRLRGGIDNTIAADDAAIRTNEQQYQASVPNSFGAYAGATISGGAAWLKGLSALRAGGVIPTVSRLAPGATLAERTANLAARTGIQAGEGGLIGVAQPVTGDAPYAQQKAAQIGGGIVGGGILPVLGAGARSLVRIFDPSGVADSKLAALLAHDPQAEQKLAASMNRVPGVVPSVADAVPSTKLTATDRLMRNRQSADFQPFNNRDIANNQARMAVVNDLAGTDQQLAAAHTALKAATAPFRKANLPESGSPLVDAGPVTAVLQKLTKSADSSIANEAKRHLAVMESNAVKGKVPAYTLDDIRQNTGNSIDNRFTAQQQARYGPVKTAITNTLEPAIPGYRGYLAAYAKGSEPINTMESVRALRDKAALAGNNAGGDQTVTLATVRQLLKADDKARYPMADSARAKLEAVFKTLQDRSTANNAIGAAGSQTQHNISAALGKEVGKYAGASALGSLASAAAGLPGGYEAGLALGAIGRAGYKFATRRADEAIANRLADSGVALAAIRKAAAQPNGLQKLSQQYLPNVFPPHR